MSTISEAKRVIVSNIDNISKYMNGTHVDELFSDVLNRLKIKPVNIYFDFVGYIYDNNIYDNMLYNTLYARQVVLVRGFTFICNSDSYTVAYESNSPKMFYRSSGTSRSTNLSEIWLPFVGFKDSFGDNLYKYATTLNDQENTNNENEANSNKKLTRKINKHKRVSKKLTKQQPHIDRFQISSNSNFSIKEFIKSEESILYSIINDKSGESLNISDEQKREIFYSGRFITLENIIISMCLKEFSAINCNFKKKQYEINKSIPNRDVYFQPTIFVKKTEAFSHGITNLDASPDFCLRTTTDAKNTNIISTIRELYARVAYLLRDGKELFDIESMISEDVEKKLKEITEINVNYTAKQKGYNTDSITITNEILKDFKFNLDKIFTPGLNIYHIGSLYNSAYKVFKSQAPLKSLYNSAYKVFKSQAPLRRFIATTSTSKTEPASVSAPVTVPVSAPVTVPEPLFKSKKPSGLILPTSQ
jgi:hypothetical protein